MSESESGSSIASQSQSQQQHEAPLYNVPAPREFPTPSADATTLFKQQVAEWIKLDDQVKKLQVAIRERRTHQRALSTKVQEFMIKYGYDNLNTTQGVIRSNVRQVKLPLKLSDVRSKLEEIGDEPLTANQVIERVFEAERPTVTKQSLLRRIPKVSMSLDL